MSDEEKPKVLFALVNCLCAATFNVAFLVLGILLFKSDTGHYGPVLAYETAEWNQGPIINITAVNSKQSCPYGFETVTGTFYGTETYCEPRFSDNYYNG